MFKKNTIIVVLLSLSIFALSACGSRAIQETPTVQLEATVNAMVQDSLQAQADTQATIDAAVQATQTVIASQATPVPVDEDYYKMTEEELSALIDEAVAAAIEASEEVYTSTTSATSDNTVSDQEVVYVSYAAVYADDAIAYAEELLDIYYDVYGAYAEDAINAMYEVESELESISNSLDSMEELLYQGADSLNAALDELNSAAQQMQTNVAAVQEHTQDWMSSYQSTLDSRKNDLSSIKPNMEAGDRSQMIDMINGYVDEIRSGLSDHSLNQDEIRGIIQSGVNAQAAIDKFGGGQMQGWSDSITNLNRNAMQGNALELQSGLKNFTVALPELNKRR